MATTARYALRDLPIPSDAPKPDGASPWVLSFDAASSRALLRMIPEPEPTPVYDALHAECVEDREFWLAARRTAREIRDLNRKAQRGFADIRALREEMGLAPGDRVLDLRLEEP